VMRVYGDGCVAVGGGGVDRLASAEAIERVCEPTMAKASSPGWEVAGMPLIEFPSRENLSKLVEGGVVAGSKLDLLEVAFNFLALEMHVTL
jgi:hypothetical protein